MRAQALDALTQRIVRRYHGYGLMLMGALAGALDSAEPLSPVVKRRLYEQTAHGFAEEQALIGQQIHAFTEEVMGMAIADVRSAFDVVSGDVFVGLVQEEVHEFAFAEADDALLTLSAQMSRDRRAVMRFQREFALEVQILATSEKRSERSAQIATRIKKESPERIYLDRSGKRWKGDRFAEVLVRSHLFKIYNETYLLALLTLGKNRAQVSAQDSSHRNHNLVFTIRDPEQGYPSYREIRKEIFHPNSRALVVAYKSPMTYN